MIDFELLLTWLVYAGARRARARPLLFEALGNVRTAATHLRDCGNLALELAARGCAP